MGMNSFAPGSFECGQFVVRNISPQKKTINIFNYPINLGCSRDLLRIRGVAETDIKSALMKGQLRNKFLVGDIELVFSNIDLLQFNDCGIKYLEGYGFTTGVLVGFDQLDGYTQQLILNGGGGGGITPFEHETLRQLIHFIDEGPGDGFASGAFKEVLPAGSPFPTQITWYLSVSKTQKLVEKFISYNALHFPEQILWNMYDYDGVTLVHTVIDTFTYEGPFETSRTRSIS
jgi:hypothetical protein